MDIKPNDIKTNQSQLNTSLEEYIVKGDDTLTKIALKFNSSIGEICILNHLSSKMIYPSQVLHIPVSRDIKEESPSATSLNITNSSTNTPMKDQHKLFPGTYSPVQLYVPPPKKINNHYHIDKHRGYIKLEAGIIKNKDLNDKSFVEITLNPSCIGINFTELTNENAIKTYMSTGLVYRGSDTAPNNFSIPYKCIESVSFYHTFESLFDENANDYAIEPISPRFNAEKSKRSSQREPMHRLRSTNDEFPNKDSKNISVQIDPSDSDLSPNYINSSPKSLKDYPSLKVHKEVDTSDYENASGIFAKLQLFGSALEPPQHIRQSKGNYRQAKKSIITDIPNYKPGETFTGGLRHNTLSSGNSTEGEGDNEKIKIMHFIYVLIKIRQDLTKSCVNLLSECKSACEVDDANKIALEINFLHLKSFSEFIDNHLPPKKALSKEYLISDVQQNLLHEVVSGIEKIDITDSLPKLNQESNIITQSLLEELSLYFPSRAMLQPLTLGYSTEIHGTSISTLYRNMLNFEDVPSLFLVKDDKDFIFGAILSCLPRISFEFYGNGECIMFSKAPQSPTKFFTWTQKNSYFIKGDIRFLAFGAGREGYGLWINDDLLHGHSAKCETFDNDTLSQDSDFKCQLIEIWVFQAT